MLFTKIEAFISSFQIRMTIIFFYCLIVLASTSEKNLKSSGDKGGHTSLILHFKETFILSPLGMVYGFFSLYVLIKCISLVLFL